MPLQQVTIKLSPRVAWAFQSTDGTLTFDLPPKAIQALAEHGLRVMASDCIATATYREGDPLDILWEKLDALSKD